MTSVIAFDVNETLLDLRALDAPFEELLALRRRDLGRQRTRGQARHRAVSGDGPGLRRADRRVRLGQPALMASRARNDVPERRR